MQQLFSFSKTCILNYLQVREKKRSLSFPPNISCKCHAVNYPSASIDFDVFTTQKYIFHFIIFLVPVAIFVSSVYVLYQLDYLGFLQLVFQRVCKKIIQDIGFLGYIMSGSNYEEFDTLFGRFCNIYNCICEQNMPVKIS